MLPSALLFFSQRSSLIWFIAQSHKDLLSHSKCNPYRYKHKWRGRNAVIGLGTSYIKDIFNYWLFFHMFYFPFMSPAVPGYNSIVSQKSLKHHKVLKNINRLWDSFLFSILFFKTLVVEIYLKGLTEFLSRMTPRAGTFKKTIKLWWN